MQKIINHFGSQANLRRALNEHFNLKLRTAHIYYWINTKLPAERAKQLVIISNLHGLDISLKDLRPDIFE